MTHRRGALGAVAGAVVASAAARAPFLGSPLAPDEAGALVVARVVEAGGGWYVDAFVDRPQGSVWAAMAADRLADGDPRALRVLALVAGALLVVAVAAVARRVSGSWPATVAAAWLAAALTSTPALEGHTANGELLAGTLAASAVAVGAAATHGRRGAGASLLAGALGAAAVATKQSGFDALVALAAWWAVAARAGWRPIAACRRSLVALAVGAGAVGAAVVAHGARLGWDRYAYAVVGFRLEARNAAVGPQLGRLAVTAGLALVLVAGALAVAWSAWRRDGGTGRSLASAAARPGPALVVLWSGAAAVAIGIGGNYHRHYWIQLAVPASVGLGMAIAHGVADGGELARRLVPALAVPVLATAVVAVAPTVERDGRLDADRALAAWVDDRPGDPELLVLCASPTFYVEADRLPPFPYLWVDHVRLADGATDDLVALLEGPARPDLVALQQPVARCDPDGRVATALEARYRPTATVDGVEVLAAT